MLESLARRDLPVITGVVMFATLAVIVFAWSSTALTTIDPRSRITQTDFEGSAARTPNRARVREASPRRRARSLSVGVRP